MKLEGVIHCEAADCEHHQHVGVDSMQADRLPPGWVIYREFGDAGTVGEWAFCHGSCALKWLAQSPGSEPPEIIEWRDALGGDPDAE